MDVVAIIMGDFKVQKYQCNAIPMVTASHIQLFFFYAFLTAQAASVSLFVVTNACCFS